VRLSLKCRASGFVQSQNQICKKTALQTPKSGKYDYFATFNPQDTSMASKNFTGDYTKSH
jgi:hypothetical protein